MTFDVRRTLEAAAEPGRERPFQRTAYDAMERGRKYKRRRAFFAAGGGSTVAAVAVGALVFGFSSLLGSDDGRDGSGPPVAEPSDDRPGVFEREPVTEAEAVRRCGQQLENSGIVKFPVRDSDGDGHHLEEVDWSKPHKWRINPIDKQLDSLWLKELYVGGSPPIELKFGGSWYITPWCSVAEEGRAADSGRIQGEPVDADDTDGILRQCGEIAGYDFTGWDVLTAMDALGGVEAILLSKNEHMATCTIEAADNVYVNPWVNISDLSEAEETREAQESASNGTLGPHCVTLEPFGVDGYSGVGRFEGEGVYSEEGDRLWRPNGKLATNVAELRFELPDGSVVTQEVVEGKWAVRFAYEIPAGGPIPVTMLDADGDVVAERNALDGNCYDD